MQKIRTSYSGFHKEILENIAKELNIDRNSLDNIFLKNSLNIFNIFSKPLENILSNLQINQKYSVESGIQTTFLIEKRAYYFIKNSLLERRSFKSYCEMIRFYIIYTLPYLFNYLYYNKNHFLFNKNDFFKESQMKYATIYLPLKFNYLFNVLSSFGIFQISFSEYLRNLSFFAFFHNQIIDEKISNLEKRYSVKNNIDFSTISLSLDKNLYNNLKNFIIPNRNGLFMSFSELLRISFLYNIPTIESMLQIPSKNKIQISSYLKQSFPYFIKKEAEKDAFIITNYSINLNNF